MSLDVPKVTPASQWLNTYVGLGVKDGDSWNPLGAGVLVVDNPLVWLVTSRRVYEAVGSDQALTTLVSREGGVTLVDLTTGRRDVSSPLAWILHASLDLAVSIFPIDPAWRLRAFPEARCFRGADLEPLQSSAILSAPYSLSPQPGDPPLVLDGTISRVVADREILTSATLLPNNSGAPLVVTLPQQSGGGVALAGIAVRTLALAESHQSSVGPVRLAAAVPIGAALDLIRSEAGKAQRKSALAAAKG